MLNQLPLELLTQIARQLDAEYLPVRQYALVCRAWQIAFEGFVYNSVMMHNDKISEFDSNIFKYHRRSFISILAYQIHGKRYNKDNVLRRANDEAFESGILKVMQYFRTWNGAHQLRLVLQLSGDEEALEPGTERNELVKKYADLRKGDLTPRPYRARFLNDGNTLELPTLSSVHGLSFANRNGIYNPVHRIWPDAALRIASCCPNLHSLFLDTKEYVRPDHGDYMRERREALGEGLSCLPASLRIFHTQYVYDDVWHGSLPGPDLTVDGQDILSINLRSAKWLLDPTEEEEEENQIPHWDNPSQYDSGSFETIEESPYERSQLKLNLCHRCFTSIGLAAQHMPRLRSAAFYFCLGPYPALLLSTDAVSGTRTLTWRGDYDAAEGYIPKQSVARAWGFDFND
ncbi:hypothetical protein BDV19DRAFT_393052 [Aspergillus venezuelensis]